MTGCQIFMGSIYIGKYTSPVGSYGKGYLAFFEYQLSELVNYKIILPKFQECKQFVQ